MVRRWQAGESQRGIARVTGLPREMVNKYLAAAGTLGLLPNGPPPNEEQVVFASARRTAEPGGRSGFSGPLTHGNRRG